MSAVGREFPEINLNTPYDQTREIHALGGLSGQTDYEQNLVLDEFQKVSIYNVGIHCQQAV